MNYRSEEYRQKKREFRLKWMKENPDKTAWRLANMSYPEKVFLNKLKELNLDKRHLIVRERSVYPYFVDFAFENEKVAVEVDGSQHQLPERMESDRKKDELLMSLGWRVIRFTAREVNTNVNECMSILLDFLRSDIQFKRFGLYSNIDFKKIKLSCTNCNKEFYKRKIKKNINNRYFCCLSCSTIFNNKVSKKKPKKINIQKKSPHSNITKRSLVNKSLRKVERPTYDELLKNISELGYTGSGRRYGVSPSAIRKWILQYEKYGSNF